MTRTDDITTATSGPSAEAVAAAMRRLYGRGLTTATGGNISVRDGDDLWITPKGFDKGRVGGGDVVCVHPGGTHEGRKPPSSELPGHLAIYRARDDIQAIVHAHPEALVAFSLCHQVPDLAHLPALARACGPCGEVPYEMTGTEALGLRIAGVLAGGIEVATLQNHGAIAVGSTLAEALTRFETFEHAARILTAARRLGTLREPPAVSTAAATVTLSGGADACVDAAGESADLVMFLERAETRGLVAIHGSASQRADGGVVRLATVSPCEQRGSTRVVLREIDLDDGETDAAAALHRSLYRAHPDVRAAFVGTPVHATALGLVEPALDTRTIPESFILLRDVAMVELEDMAGIAGHVAPERPAALVRNLGVVTVGTSLFDAYDRLEVVESTAQSLVIARTLGPLHPLTAQNIEELERRFPAPAHGLGWRG